MTCWLDSLSVLPASRELGQDLTLLWAPELWKATRRLGPLDRCQTSQPWPPLCSLRCLRSGTLLGKDKKASVS